MAWGALVTWNWRRPSSNGVGRGGAGATAKEEVTKIMAAARTAAAERQAKEEVTKQLRTGLDW
jgi:hypothetical protein